ncbi:hypothetical protein [Chondromyces apiculatus]|uniref:Uncharacterized protein n=1 Tax=Chondromyces apiculatus DSM 436 TaxID=1192034 RepID=A0A017TCQ7_9BACT|nr:hypothetical protein [Chondromyces apiculatus]EYF06421.1 Hypothetical protein CAP_1951 [Chondromyces apiculatus DSM 436]
MSVPVMNTTVDRCELKSLHTCTMIHKFDQVPALTGLAASLEAATTNLLARQTAYTAKTKALIKLRVEVRYTDLIADQGVRMSLRMAEIADGKPGGRVAKTLFPNGTTPIIRPIGGTQVKEMRGLEGRYKEVEALFPAAPDERLKIEALRQRYEAALQGRLVGMEECAQARAARNLAKEEFLDVFTEVANRIRAAFPRDKKTQALFFLRDKAVSAVEEGEGEEDEEVEEEGEATAEAR